MKKNITIFSIIIAVTIIFLIVSVLIIQRQEEELLVEYLDGPYYDNLKEALASEKPVYRLELVGQELKVIPPTIRELEELRVLNLSNNNLSEFPSIITELNNLRALYLDDNSLSEIPEEISRLNNLEIITLSNNKLTEEEEQRVMSFLPQAIIVFGFHEEEETWEMEELI